MNKTAHMTANAMASGHAREDHKIVLSICIATYNRPGFIGSTLDSIISQLTNSCEIVVADSSANDETEKALVERLRECHQLRYIRHRDNRGIDEDYDRVVQLARGKYCWLMTDDDLLKEGGIAAVLAILKRDVSLVLVNVEFCNFSMTRVIQSRWINLISDRTYSPAELDKLFVDVDETLKYVGCVVIKREIWLARDRRKYYGSWFVYAGVIFQSRLPSEAVVVAQPYVSYRMGNTQTFTSNISEIVWDKWPSVLAASGLSTSSTALVSSAQPWRSTRELFRLRALGFYSLVEYHRWAKPKLQTATERWRAKVIAVLPATIVNALSVIYYSVSTFHARGLWLHEMRMSPRNLRNRMRWFSERRRSVGSIGAARGSESSG